MNPGNRKLSKINALKKLNEKYDLGLTEKYIEELTTSQLCKILLQTRLEHNLSIHSMTKIPKSFD